MKKLFVCFAFLGLIAGLSISNQPQVVAQVKKDTKKETKKDSGGIIEIAEGKDGKFRFFVRDGAGKLLAMSGPSGFASEKEAQKAIEDLKAVVGTAKVSVKKDDKK